MAAPGHQSKEPTRKPITAVLPTRSASVSFRSSWALISLALMAVMMVFGNTSAKPPLGRTPIAWTHVLAEGPAFLDGRLPSEFRFVNDRPGHRPNCPPSAARKATEIAPQ